MSKTEHLTMVDTNEPADIAPTFIRASRVLAGLYQDPAGHGAAEAVRQFIATASCEKHGALADPIVFATQVIYPPSLLKDSEFRINAACPECAGKALRERWESEAVLYWWLSFADADLPKGSQFLGATVIEAPDMISAVTRAHALGCNPGGEVVGHAIAPEYSYRIEPWMVGRLMSRAECEAFDAKWDGK
jgi:hypothetical protein